MNALLRHADRARLKPLYDYLAIFFRAVEKLPKHAVVTYRGIRRAHSALTPAGAYDEGGIILVLECRHAVDIREFSNFQGNASEEEFLLVPGTPFVCKSVLVAGGGLTIV